MIKSDGIMIFWFKSRGNFVLHLLKKSSEMLSGHAYLLQRSKILPLQSISARSYIRILALTSINAP